MWFGDIEAQTAFRSQNSITCTVPDVSIFKSTTSSIYSNSYSSWSPNNKDNQPIQVPLNLVRNDGIIYNTGLSFTYTPESPNLDL